MLTTKYIKDNLKIFMNRKCNNSFVILCVREEGQHDRTAMLIDWCQALKLVEEWVGLKLTRDDFVEDSYVYKNIEPVEAVPVKVYADREGLFRDGN